MHSRLPIMLSTIAIAEFLETSITWQIPKFCMEIASLFQLQTMCRIVLLIDIFQLLRLIYFLDLTLTKLYFLKENKKFWSFGSLYNCVCTSYIRVFIIERSLSLSVIKFIRARSTECNTLTLMIRTVCTVYLQETKRNCNMSGKSISTSCPLYTTEVILYDGIHGRTPVQLGIKPQVAQHCKTDVLIQLRYCPEWTTVITIYVRRP